MTRQVYLTNTQRIILIALYTKIEGLTRAELQQKTNIARTTLYDNLKKLEDLHVLKREKDENGMVGRSKIVWRWRIAKEGWHDV